MAGREDYILREIALLRQAISVMLKYRESGRHREALDEALRAQEKLFARSTVELSALSLEDLIALARKDETPEGGDEKLLAYAAMLRETGLVYAAMDRETAAESCFQLALHVMLTVAAGQNPPAAATLATMRELLARIPADMLQAPVIELLARFGEPA